MDRPASGDSAVAPKGGKGQARAGSLPHLGCDPRVYSFEVTDWALSACPLRPGFDPDPAKVRRFSRVRDPA
jgi:hypothetical protein